jgi:hypothetical protein
MSDRVQECWNVCFGEESILARVQSFDLFAPLFHNLEFEVVEDEQFDALARQDGPDGCAISLTTGTQAFLQPVFDQALTLLAHEDSRPWRLLGLDRRTLELATDSGAAFFAYFLRTEITATSARYAGLNDIGFLRVFACASQVVFAKFPRLDVQFGEYRELTASTESDPAPTAERTHPHPEAYKPWIYHADSLLTETNRLIDHTATMARLVEPGSRWELMNRQSDEQHRTLNRL